MNNNRKAAENTQDDQHGYINNNIPYVVVND